MNSSNESCNVVRANADSFLWRALLFYVQPAIAVAAMLLNVIILVVMSFRSVTVSPMAKMYYCACALGTLPIAFKIFAVFMIQFTCHVQIGALCTFLKSNAYFWKYTMTAWLSGEVLSNGSLMLLSVERLVAIALPHRARNCLLLRTNLVLLLLTTAPSIAYLAVFGPQLYIIEPSPEIFPGVLINIDLDNPNHEHFSLYSKLVCFMIPIFTSALLCLFIFFKIWRLHVERKNRSALSALSTSDFSSSDKPCRSNGKKRRSATVHECCTRRADSFQTARPMRLDGQNGVHVGGAAFVHGLRQRVQAAADTLRKRPDRRSVRMARVAVALSFLNILLYFPVLAFWQAFELINKHLAIECKSELFAVILPVGAFLFSFSGLAHIANFFVYLTFVRSFRRRILCCFGGFSSATEVHTNSLNRASSRAQSSRRRRGLSEDRNAPLSRNSRQSLDGRTGLKASQSIPLLPVTLPNKEASTLLTVSHSESNEQISLPQHAPEIKAAEN